MARKSKSNAKHSSYAEAVKAIKKTSRFYSGMGYYKTGILAFDEVFYGKGLPKGKVVELSSREGTGKCVLGSTMIPCFSGMRRIDSFFEESRFSYQKECHRSLIRDGRLVRTSHKYFSGERKALKLVLESGLVLVGSYLHPVLVERGRDCIWVPLEDIEDGDIVITEVNKISYLNDSKSYLLGLMYGDGSFKKKQKHYYESDDSHFLKMFQSIGGVVKKNKKDIRSKVYFPDKGVFSKESFEKLGFYGELRSIPDSILNGSWSEQCSFVEGILISSSVETYANSTLVLRSKQRRVVDFVEQISRYMGYTTHRSVYNGKGYLYNRISFKEVPQLRDKPDTVFYQRDPVAFVESYKDSLLYDLTVPNGSSYVGNSIKIHNTTMLLHAAKNLCSEGQNVLYIDAEFAVTPSQLSGTGLESYLDSSFNLIQENRYSAISDILDSLLPYSLAMVVIDSITAVRPSQLTEMNVEEVQPGLISRLQSTFLQKYTDQVANYGTTMVLINQMRTKLNFRGISSEGPGGGNALKFYTDVRLTMRRKAWLTRKDPHSDEDVNYGSDVVIDSIKNKVCASKKTEATIIFGVGVSNVSFIQKALIAKGYLHQSSSYFKFSTPELTTTIQGRTNAMDYIKTHYDYFTSLVTGETYVPEEKPEAIDPDSVDIQPQKEVEEEVLSPTESVKSTRAKFSI